MPYSCLTWTKQPVELVFAASFDGKTDDWIGAREIVSKQTDTNTAERKEANEILLLKCHQHGRREMLKRLTCRLVLNARGDFSATFHAKASNWNIFSVF